MPQSGDGWPTVDDDSDGAGAETSPEPDAGSTDELPVPEPEQATRVVPVPPREEQKTQPVSWPAPEDEPDPTPAPAEGQSEVAPGEGPVQQDSAREEPQWPDEPPRDESSTDQAERSSPEQERQEGSRQESPREQSELSQAPREQQDRSPQESSSEDQAPLEQPSQDRSRSSQASPEQGRQEDSPQESPSQDEVPLDESRQESPPRGQPRQEPSSREQVPQDRSRSSQAPPEQPAQEPPRQGLPQDEVPLEQLRPDRSPSSQAPPGQLSQEQSRQDDSRPESPSQDEVRLDESRQESPPVDQPAQGQVRQDRSRQAPSQVQPGQESSRLELPQDEVPLEQSRPVDQPAQGQVRQEQWRQESPSQVQPQQDRSRLDQPPQEQSRQDRPRQEPSSRDQPSQVQPRQERARLDQPPQQARQDRPRQEPPPLDQPPHDRSRSDSFRQEGRLASPWQDSPPPGHPPRHDVNAPRPPGEATIRHDQRRPDPPGEATIRVPRPPLPPPHRPDAPQRGTAFWDQHAPQRPPDQWPPPEPPRAAPVRVGPPPANEPEPEPAPPTRRKPLLVTVAVVAVLALAAGVIFGVPGLSDTLGITDSEPEVAIDPPAPPIEFTPGLRAPGTDAPAPTATGVQAALAGPAAAPALGTLTGVVLDPASGETLWQSDPTTPLVPASTTKLLTAAAALLSLDHTEQLVTKVVEGTEPGSVVVVGGGDPTLSSLKTGVDSVYPGAAHLSELVDQVEASGTPVESVHVDLSRYQGESLARGWLRVDIGAGFIAPMVPLMLDGGRSDARAQNGTRTDNPARAVADELANRLGASVPASAETTAPEGAKVLGEVRSAPMVELVDTMLRTSDNVLGEAIAREVARAAGKEVSFEGAAEATREVLSANGFDLTGVELADGSGLSTENRVPAALLAEILNVAAAPDGGDPRTAKLRPLLSGLPVAGGSGTLDDRYGSAETAAGKGYVRAKTGTLSGVNSLAGVLLDQDGRVLVFALMTANTDSSARPALDAMVAAVRACGCR